VGETGKGAIEAWISKEREGNHAFKSTGLNESRKKKDVRVVERKADHEQEVGKKIS